MKVVKIMMREWETVFPFEIIELAQKYTEENIDWFSFVKNIIEIENVFNTEEEIAKENGNMISWFYNKTTPYELLNKKNWINVYIL